MELSPAATELLRNALANDVKRTVRNVQASREALRRAEEAVRHRRQDLETAIGDEQAARQNVETFATTGTLSRRDMGAISVQTCLVVGSKHFNRLSELDLVTSNGWTELGREIRAWSTSKQPVAA